MPTISVIIPVFNAECYLAKCIDSVLHQTFIDFELLIVNDGSTDKTAHICDQYADTDSRVKVVHQTNAGQSCARNAALEIAKGEYIAFIDADDVISPDYLRVLYEVACKTGSQISCVNYCKEQSKLLLTVKDIFIKTFTPDEAIDDTLYQKTLNCSVWSKLFDKRLFKNTRFRENIIYEDLEIMMKLYEQTDSVAFADFPLYFYRTTPGSSLSVFSPRRFSVLDVVDEIYDRYDDTPHRLSALDRQFSAHFNMLVLIIRNGYKYESMAKRCYSMIVKARFTELKNPNVRIKNKLGALISYFGFPTIKFIAKTIKV